MLVRWLEPLVKTSVRNSAELLKIKNAHDLKPRDSTSRNLPNRNLQMYKGKTKKFHMQIIWKYNKAKITYIFTRDCL